MGSAHPFRARDGSYVGMLETNRLMSPEPLPEVAPEEFMVYKFDGQTAELVRSLKVANSSYAHSFGYIEGDVAVIMKQPVFASAMQMMTQGTLKTAFHTDLSLSTKVSIISLADATEPPVEIDLDETLFFGHFINTFRATLNAKEYIVVDIILQKHIFMDRFDLTYQKGKRTRDQWAKSYTPQTATRMLLDTATRTVAKQPLFPDITGNGIGELFLPKLNQQYYGQKNCYVWGIQSAFVNQSYAQQAIVKGNVCNTDQQPTASGAIERQWFRANWYPMEPSFAAAPNAAREDDGLIMFQAYDGVGKASWLIVLDAATLGTISEARLPVRNTYSVHGQFYSTPAAAHSE
jgi:carotenoid cleavage dioxygenase-like enzyme